MNYYLIQIWIYLNFFRYNSTLIPCFVCLNFFTTISQLPTMFKQNNCTLSTENFLATASM